MIAPKSPCKASEPCIKIDGVPVEFKVEDIFIPIIALFPIPETTILPLIFDKNLIISSKLLSKVSFSFSIASS